MHTTKQPLVYCTSILLLNSSILPLAYYFSLLLLFLLDFPHFDLLLYSVRDREFLSFLNKILQGNLQVRKITARCPQRFFENSKF